LVGQRKGWFNEMRRLKLFGRWTHAAALSTLLFAFAGVLSVDAKEPQHRAHGQGRLFEVTAAAIEPSYVFGTMHSTDPEILELPTPAARAFGDSTRLILELVFRPELESRMHEAMLLGDGRTLTEIIGPELFSRLMRRAALYGLPVGQMNRMKPWAAGLVLSLPVDELDRGASGAIALDCALQQAADARGIPAFGLETMDEQITAFSDQSEEDQIASLRMTIELNPQIDALFTEMKKAYLAGDLDYLHTMAETVASGTDDRLARQFEERFIGLRNRRMANRMARHVKLGAAFIAIGALHLSGEDGVLKLLEKRGYKIKRLY